MTKEQEFLKELKMLFKKYSIKIGHSLDYDYNEEICADDLYLYTNLNPPDCFLIDLVGTELETKLKDIKLKQCNKIKEPKPDNFFSNWEKVIKKELK